jgi:hypothetical protein
MAVQFVFEKPKQQEVPAAALVEQSASEMLADELLILDAKLKTLGVPEIEKRIKEIKSNLQLIAADSLESYTGWVINAQHGDVTVSPCKKMTEIVDQDGLIAYIDAKVGHEATIGVLEFAITKLRKIMGENEITKFAKEVPGARSITVTHKPEHASNSHSA